MRKEIEERLRIKAIDIYGLSEIIGPGVSSECIEAQNGLHINEDHFLAEIVDPRTGEPLPYGQRGELVLTTLDRVGSPLLRYRTGDLVNPRSRSACACGRYELAFEGGILGRSDDMVVVRGVNVYPSLVEEIVRAFPEVTEYRVELDCRGSMIPVSVFLSAIIDR
jgi:phenylacetate-CoA ligase